MKKWLDYQLLAAKIYTDLSPNAAVTHDDKIMGVETGEKRQIDVSIRTQIAGHEILIIVQAKNLTRPADVNIVGEFHSVIKDVRASKGVLICSKGFTKKAKNYARNLGIDLCTIHDAQNRNWNLDLTLPIVWLKHDVKYNFTYSLIADAPNAEPVTISEDTNKWVLSTDRGKTQLRLYQIFQEIWNRPTLNRTPGKSHQVASNIPNLRLKFEQNYWCPMTDMIWEYFIIQSAWLGSFRIPEARAIHNILEDQLRARLIIKSADIPMQRDESWQAIEDANLLIENMPNVIIIEEWPTVGEDSLNNTASNFHLE